MQKIKYLYRASPFAYIGVYFIVHLPWLTSFPFIHSDEGWLGGLTRNMMATGSFGCTEPFFDAKQRTPHAIKTLFHFLQSVFIWLFDYSPFTLRLLSLIISCACLAAFYFCALRLIGSPIAAFCTMVLLSADIQFIYTAHFARSEIFILLAVCLCIYFLLNDIASLRTAVICGVITGLCVFVHPNSFLLACACGCTLLYKCVQLQKYKPLLLFCGIAGCFAVIAVGISYSFANNFLPDYFAYGQKEFALWSGATENISGVAGFFERLWTRQSGTYYLPNIKLSLFLFISCGALCCIFAAIMRKEMPKQAKNIFSLIVFELGLLAGLVLMGRFNQTYIIFLYPVGILITVMACRIISQRFETALICICIFAMALSSALQIKKQLTHPPYSGYITQLSELVPKDEKTLGNLNTSFYFENDALLDYRNLPYALETGTIEDYIAKNKIKYIVYSTELDFIYQNRPYFNVVYGNAMFVPQLKSFCENSCVEVGSFINTGYGARIIGIMGNEEYSKITVYKVN